MSNYEEATDKLRSLLDANDEKLESVEEIAEMLLANADEFLGILGQFEGDMA